MHPSAAGGPKLWERGLCWSAEAQAEPSLLNIPPTSLLPVSFHSSLMLLGSACSMCSEEGDFNLFK